MSKNRTSATGCWPRVVEGQEKESRQLRTSATGVSSPKRKVNRRSKRSLLYDFYAGYSESFAIDALNGIVADDPGVMVFDPWNGSGTTTWAAAKLRCRVVGIDVNPAMVVVAKARLAERRALRKLMEMSQLLSPSELSGTAPGWLPHDPLQQWFSEGTVRRLRSLQKKIGLETRLPPTTHSAYVESFSNNRSFTCVTLFKLIRKLTSHFQASNPTWIRVPASLDDKINCSSNEILAAYRSVFDDIDPETLSSNPKRDFGRVSVFSADARDFEISNHCGELQCILTSPPYCTRIDYAIATRRELAVLGANATEVRRLRESQIGTPVIVKLDIEVDEEGWGRTCTVFLNAVRSHDSKASSTYYLKGHLQYFDGIYSIVKRSAEALTPHGTFILVVQGSYYKEIPIDLPRIIQEMGASLGLECERCFEFRSPSRYRHNPHARTRNLGTPNFERVLFLRKKS